MALMIEKTYTQVQRTAHIVSRHEYDGGTVVYTCLSSDASKRYYVSVKQGRAQSCTCRTLPDGRVSRYECYHMTTCTRAEAAHIHASQQWDESDTRAHVKDSIRSGAFESCLGCGARVKKPNSYCHNC